MWRQFSRKRVILFATISFVFVVAIARSIEPAIIFFAKKQIEKTFSGSTVLIKACDVRIFSRISLCDIEIKKPGAYDLKIGEARTAYSLWSILQRNIRKVSLQNVVAEMNLTQHDLAAFNFLSGPRSSGVFSLDSLELSNLKIKGKAGDVTVDARVSLELNLGKSAMESLDLQLSSLIWRDLTLEDGLVKIGPQQPGKLFIQKLQYAKFKVADIKAQVRTTGTAVFVEPLTGQALNGEIKGQLSVKLSPAPEYWAKVAFTKIDLAAVALEFDLKDEVQLSGMISGYVTVTGRGADFKIIDGDFLADGSGGSLVIKNKEFLKMLARNSQQPLDIVVASFQDYHYNVGTLQFSLEKGDLMFAAALEGEAGKRNLNITLHDFNQGGMGP